MIKVYNKRMDLSVKSSIAVLMNIGMRKRTYILMLSLMSFMMAFSQKDTRVGYRDMFREFNTLQGGMTRYDGWNFTVENFYDIPYWHTARNG